MILTAISKLLFAMGIGYYLNKKDIFTAEVNQKLSSFVMNVCLPLVILTSLNQTDDAMSKGLMMKYILTGGAIYALLPFLSKGLNRMSRVPKEQRPVYELAYVFSNTLFMGFPIAASLFGNECVFQICVFNLGFDILYFTYGISLLCRGKQGGKGKVSLKDLLGPGTLASLAALVMFFMDVQLPDGAAEVCNFLGDLASPLSMVVIGANIGTYSVRNMLTYDRKIYLVAFIKLIVLPIAVYALMTALDFDGMLRGVAVISFGMPVAAVVSMGCIEYEYQEELSSALVISTTILSLPFVPVLLTVLG